MPAVTVCGCSIKHAPNIRVTFPSGSTKIDDPLREHVGLGYLFWVCQTCYRPDKKTAWLHKSYCEKCWDIYSTPVPEQVCKRCHLSLLSERGLAPQDDPYKGWEGLRRRLRDLGLRPGCDPYRLDHPRHVYYDDLGWEPRFVPGGVL